MKKCFAVLLTMVLLCSFAWSTSAATLTVTEPAQNNGVVTISGTVTNDTPEGYRQQVVILVVNDGANVNSLSESDIVYINQTEADNSGNYSLTFTMPVAQQTGTYDVYVGAMDVTPAEETTLDFTTPAPTEAPTADPVATPEVGLGNAKPAVNGSNAFYYLITITLNDGVTTGFNVKHYPSDLATQVEQNATIAENQDFSIANISGATVKVISVLKDIPNSEADRSITTKATLSFTLGGNASSVTDTETTTLNTTKGY